MATKLAFRLLLLWGVLFVCSCNEDFVDEVSSLLSNTDSDGVSDGVGNEAAGPCGNQEALLCGGCKAMLTGATLPAGVNSTFCLGTCPKYLPCVSQQTNDQYANQAAAAGINVNEIAGNLRK